MYYSRGHNEVCRTKCSPESWMITAVAMFVFFLSERTNSAKGDPAVYRLKDWPSGEEFLALMPSRLVFHISTFSSAYTD